MTVVLPASMWAMNPMFRVRSSGALDDAALSVRVLSEVLVVMGDTFESSNGYKEGGGVAYQR